MDIPNNSLLKKIQYTEIKILDEVVRICDKYNLTYFFVEGTLLGAIRHHGFIPWDDDIDIGMPRNDYKTFIELCPTELNPRYILQWQNNEKLYWLPFVKVRMRYTVYDEGSAPKGLIENGFFLDIFPLDQIKGHESVNEKIKGHILLKLSHVAHTLSFSWNSKRKKAIQFICKIFHITQRRLLNLYDTISHKQKGHYIVNRGSYYGYQKQTVPIEWYFPPRKEYFEGKLYNVPNCAEKVLTQIYGDYLQLPPEADRIPRHAALNIQFEDGTTAENLQG